MAASDIVTARSTNRRASCRQRRRSRAAGRPRPNRRLVVVSNRVGPIAAGKASEGGLAVALRAALRERGRHLVRL